MKKAAIAIDSWKLPIFKKMLKAAGYSFDKHPGVTDDTLILTVETDDVQKLTVVVAKANRASSQPPSPTVH